MPERPAARERILVVDDDERNRVLVRSALERRYEVLEAADGPSALDLDGATAVDLVILDVMMPAVSGFDVCRELKRRHRDRPFLPVLLLTALSDQADRNGGLEAGADDFLTKPVNRVELALRVEAFLRTRRQDLVIRRQLEELTHLAALKDDLVALLAHDLRSPLSAVLTLLELVRQDVGDPAMREDLEAALAAARRVRDTAEDLLEVRLLEESKLRACRQAVSLEAVVHDAIRALEVLAREREIAIRVRVQGDPVFPADAKLVRRALDNLLVNALRYGPSGGAVDVVVRRAGAAVEIEVGDRGPGVPSAARPGLFQKFGGVEARRSDPAEARRGYGLGLYLVRLVAEAHGGTASVTDREGGGAVFRVRLEGPPDA